MDEVECTDTVYRRPAGEIAGAGHSPRPRLATVLKASDSGYIIGVY